MQGLKYICLLTILICLFHVRFIKTEDDVDDIEDEEVFCIRDESKNAKKKKDETEPSFCEEVVETENEKLYSQDDYNILAAIATSVLAKTFPSKLNSQQAFAIYDELPYPVPTGASTFFMVLFTMIFTSYFTKCLRFMFSDLANKLDLLPITDHFPHINLYMLQQSRRESELNRDVRNTWAWLANFYLLKPSDPFVKPDEITKSKAWADFQVPRDVWSAIRENLRKNALKKQGKYKAPNKAASDTNKIGPGGRRSSVASDPGFSSSTIGADNETADRLMALRKMMD